ncbi:anaerobic ribonucleoside-triphosphate reductase activating protein [Cytobacillus oceanisediminis]|nr:MULTISPECIES: anaerobic ribonucleoside-triphosphate reductase activating protein [Bacillaceae]MBZ9532953.1 anaerobic ribonucleoside-triphosphate reductase activating protein [Cytobacillus oceanisediminis]NMO76820.1 anaerobic ribonucleoside-triphosphate reductase activating protein [Niallia alba]
MRVLSIVEDSIVDGPGLRTTIFFAGCTHYCRGCHNPESWRINGGREMSIDEIMSKVNQNPLNDITFSGGEPMLQIRELIQLAKECKQINKNIWCYTGFLWEELMTTYPDEFTQLSIYLDALVDGRFKIEQKDLSLLFKGSLNQRIIDCQKSLKEHKISLFNEWQQREKEVGTKQNK